MLDRDGERLLGVGHGESHVPHAVTVLGVVLDDRRVGLESGRQYESDPVLLEHVGASVTDAELGAGVSDDVESEGVR